MKTFRILTLIAFVFAALANPGAAQEKPTADAVIANWIEKSGGLAAFAKLKTRYTKSKITMQGMDIKGTIEAWENKSGQVASLTSFGGMKIEMGCNGKTFWQKHPAIGPRIIEGPERATYEREMFGNEGKWKTTYPTRKLIGEEAVDGDVCYKLELKPKDAPAETWWISKKSGLKVKAEMTSESPMGSQKVTSTMSDYKEFDGILMPTRLVQSLDQGTFTVEVVEVKHNVEIEDDRFALPADIQKLADKAAKKKAEKAAEKAGK